MVASFGSCLRWADRAFKPRFWLAASRCRQLCPLSMVIAREPRTFYSFGPASKRGARRSAERAFERPGPTLSQSHDSSEPRTQRASESLRMRVRRSVRVPGREAVRCRCRRRKDTQEYAPRTSRFVSAQHTSYGALPTWSGSPRAARSGHAQSKARGLCWKCWRRSVNNWSRTCTCRLAASWRTVSTWSWRQRDKPRTPAASPTTTTTASCTESSGQDRRGDGVPRHAVDVRDVQAVLGYVAGGVKLSPLHEIKRRGHVTLAGAVSS